MRIGFSWSIGQRQGQLSQTERGRTAPTLEVLTLLSDKFHKRIDWIVRGERHE